MSGCEQLSAMFPIGNRRSKPRRKTSMPAKRHGLVQMVDHIGRPIRGQWQTPDGNVTLGKERGCDMWVAFRRSDRHTWNSSDFKMIAEWALDPDSVGFAPKG